MSGSYTKRLQPSQTCTRLSRTHYEPSIAERIYGNSRFTAIEKTIGNHAPVYDGMQVGFSPLLFAGSIPVRSAFKVMSDAHVKYYQIGASPIKSALLFRSSELVSLLLAKQTERVRFPSTGLLGLT